LVEFASGVAKKSFLFAWGAPQEDASAVAGKKYATLFVA